MRIPTQCWSGSTGVRPAGSRCPPACVVAAAAPVPGAGHGTCGTWVTLRRHMVSGVRMCIDTKEAWINVDPRGSHWTYRALQERPGTGRWHCLSLDGRPSLHPPLGQSWVLFPGPRVLQPFLDPLLDPQRSTGRSSKIRTSECARRPRGESLAGGRQEIAGPTPVTRQTPSSSLSMARSDAIAASDLRRFFRSRAASASNCRMRCSRSASRCSDVDERRRWFLRRQPGRRRLHWCRLRRIHLH